MTTTIKISEYIHHNCLNDIELLSGRRVIPEKNYSQQKVMDWMKCGTLLRIKCLPHFVHLICYGNLIKVRERDFILNLRQVRILFKVPTIMLAMTLAQNLWCLAGIRVDNSNKVTPKALFWSYLRNQSHIRDHSFERNKSFLSLRHVLHTNMRHIQLVANKCTGKITFNCDHRRQFITEQVD